MFKRKIGLCSFLGFLVIAFTVVLTLPSCVQNGSGNNSASKTNFVTVGEDDPIYFSDFRNIVNAENGYYFTQDGWNFLYYFDKKSKKVVPVCNMPNCNHDNKSCNAYISDIRHYTGLWYYKDNIYVIGFDNGVMGLYQISKDGSTHKRCCDFAEPGREYSITSTVHRGYAYFSIDRGDNKAQLYRVELKENAEPKLIFELKQTNAGIDIVRGYNDNIIIHTSFFKDKTLETSVESLYTYSIKDKTYSRIPIDDLCGGWTFIDDNTIIYRSYSSVMKYNVETKKSTVFYSDEPLTPSYDGRYVYLDNNVNLFNSMIESGNEYETDKRCIKVMDLSGKLIDEIKIETDGECYFGDDDYLFADLNVKMSDIGKTDTDIQIENKDSIHVIGTESLTSLMAFDKSQIGTQNCEWIKLMEWDYNLLIE